MRAAIYSPYLDTFGGGERYMMTIAEVFSKSDFKVDVLLDLHLDSLGPEYLKEKLAGRFNLDLSGVNFIKGPVGKGSGILERSFFLKKYDLLFYLTDGSIFYPTSKKNILHIQSPLAGQPAKNIWGKFKLKGWDLIIYNSLFTKKNAQQNWPIKSEIIYPPVDVNKISPLKKKKYILSVGRFFGYLKDKKHETLIKAFKKLYETGKINGWSLHLAGSAGEGDKTYLEELKTLAGNLPINFCPNLGYDQLIKLYGESCIYWHAAGYEETDPVKMEHFGIATVEAMAGGCVPVVIRKGGQIEIVEEGKTGLLWDSLEQLEDFTLKLIQDEKLWEEMSGGACLRAESFNKNKFKEKILAIA